MVIISILSPLHLAVETRGRGPMVCESDTNEFPTSAMFKIFLYKFTVLIKTYIFFTLLSWVCIIHCFHFVNI